MKAFTLSPSSLHYRFATVYGPRYHSDLQQNGSDLCSYVRGVLLGVFAWLTWTIVACAVAWGLCDAIVWTIVAIQVGFMFEPNLPAAVLFFIVAAVTAIATVMFTIHTLKTWYYNWKYVKSEVRTDPGFVKLAYRSFKDKYCTKVVFE